jgi:di/tripeptidase
MELKEQMIKAARLHAEAEIELHKTNVEVYMQKVVGIGEHSDIIETIQKELDSMATAHDRLEMLEKYFSA